MFTALQKLLIYDARFISLISKFIYNIKLLTIRTISIRTGKNQKLLLHMFWASFVSLLDIFDFSAFTEFWFFRFRLIFVAQDGLLDSFDVTSIKPRLLTSNDAFDKCGVLSYVVKHYFFWLDEIFTKALGLLVRV